MLLIRGPYFFWRQLLRQTGERRSHDAQIYELVWIEKDHCVVRTSKGLLIWHIFNPDFYIKSSGLVELFWELLLCSNPILAWNSNWMEWIIFLHRQQATWDSYWRLKNMKNSIHWEPISLLLLLRHAPAFFNWGRKFVSTKCIIPLGFQKCRLNQLCHWEKSSNLMPHLRSCCTLRLGTALWEK